MVLPATSQQFQSLCSFRTFRRMRAALARLSGLGLALSLPVGEPFFIRRRWLTDRPQEAVRSAVADEPELALEVSDGFQEPATRTQITLKAPMFSIELDEGLRVVDRRLDLCFAAHDLRISE